MTAELIEKIKSRGNIRIVVRPSTHQEDQIKTLVDCRNIVEQSKVSMRGWDFPHIDKESYAADQSFIYSGTDWSRYKEYWRFYQSGQFLFLEGMTEDWQEESMGLFLESGKPLGFKGFAVDSNLYRFTELLEFIARLVSKDVFDGYVHIEINLNDTIDRKLFIYDKSRVPLVGSYISKMKEIKFSRTYTEGEIITKGPEIAIEIAVYFFERFNWTNIPLPSLNDMQQKFLSGRF